MLEITSQATQERVFYALSPHATYCEVSGALVFLDARNDRYLMLDRRQAALFHRLRGEADSESVSALAKRLVSSGILIQRREQTGTLDPFRWATPNSTISDLETAGFSDAFLSTGTFRMAQAFAVCLAFKRTTHISSILSAARSWKMNAASKSATIGVSIDAVVYRFNTLSPLFYSSYDACLFRSILLLRYLTLHGVLADLVFGVRLSPFAAHCWIQHRRKVLNDHLESAASFTPILAV